jgi:nucleoporin GLE1
LKAALVDTSRDYIMAQGKIHSSPLVARNSPRSRRLDDSPSRQLHFELERTFSQIQLQEAERQKVYVYQRRQQQEELDAKELAQAEVHRTELNLANAQHEVVRLQAEAVLHAYFKKDEEERRRREDERRRLEEEERKRREEEESRKRAEQERKAREEKERKEREERAKAEAERLAIYERQKAEAEERRRKEKEVTELKQREEKEKVEQEAALKAQEAEKAAAAAAKATIPTPPTTTTNTQIPSSNAAATTEGIHRSYLLVHKRLKQFRKEFWEKVKKDPNLKPHVGDMRRAMRTSVGQLTDDKVGNKKAVS